MRNWRKAFPIAVAVSRPVSSSWRSSFVLPGAAVSFVGTSRGELACLRDEVDVLFVIERRGFAGSARDDQKLRSGFDVKVDDLRKLPVVNRAVCIHRRDNRHHAAGQHQSDLRTPSQKGER